MNQSPMGETQEQDAAIEKTTVRHVMVTVLRTIDAGAPLAEAYRIMAERRIGALPVMEDGQLVGILSERDCLRLWSHAARGDSARPHMTPAPTTIDPGRPVMEALSIMNAGGFRHLPVAENGRLVGMISIRDLTKILNQKFKAQQVELIHSGRVAALGTVAAGIAHELKQPLTAVGAFLEGLAALMDRAPGGTNEAGKVIEKMRAQVERMTGILRNTLNFSRTQAATSKPMSVNQAAVLAIDLIHPDCKKYHIKLDVRLGEGLPDIYGNEVRFQQTILNLLINARDALKESGGVIRLETRREGSHISVWVSDDGKGIPLECRARIFEPFFTTKSAGDGAGLGLTICRDIVESHGGTIEHVQTERGTTMAVRIPVA